MTSKQYIITVLCSLALLRGFAQDIDIRGSIESSAVPWTKWKIHSEQDIREFYQVFQYRPAWTGDNNKEDLTYLLRLIDSAPYFGLDKNDYQSEFIAQYRGGLRYISGTDNRLEAEIRLTDAAIHFYRDIAFGNTTPSLSYAGLTYTPGCISVPWQLAKHLENNSIGKLIGVLHPPMPELLPLMTILDKWLNRIGDSTYKEETITSTKVNTSNKALLKKLFYLGLLDSLNGRIKDKEIKNKVKEAQQLFGLLNDGIIRKTFLKELNIPLTARIRQCNLSLNYYRWLYCLSRQQSVIVVNIPAAWLKVYHEGRVILDMKMVVGATTTPTPTLSSRISEVILYPYWTVPYSIATKELLPSIQRNPGYLDANGFQVLNSAGRVVDPGLVNWSALSPRHFPYTIRQSTGCDNSLGLLKLNFYNPFSVYLHDTPAKSLFMLSKRYFSHGCMRLEKPMELGYLVLQNNAMAIDTLEDKGCLRNQSPIVVPVDEQLPVVVWYNPAGLDAAGKPVFYEDIYRKFSSKN